MLALLQEILQYIESEQKFVQELEVVTEASRERYLNIYEKILRAISILAEDGKKEIQVKQEPTSEEDGFEVENERKDSSVDVGNIKIEGTNPKEYVESIDAMDFEEEYSENESEYDVVDEDNSKNIDTQKIKIERNDEALMDEDSDCDPVERNSGVIITMKDRNEEPKNFNQHNVEDYECRVCARKFALLSDLNIHRLSDHSEDLRYKCSMCCSNFAQPNDIRRHRIEHSDKHEYFCRYCQDVFQSLAELRRHRRIHRKMHHCDICNKAFRRPSGLSIHRRVHTGEKPFKCGICKKTFTQAVHLTTHYRIHTGEKPFECDVCSLAFADVSNLKRHRSKCHQTYQ